jgi:ABC-type transport system substrate-binding protein
VAREVIDAYPERSMEHPVGTNAYRLAQWKRSSRIVLERNPNYREHFFSEEAAPDDPASQAIAAKMKGKRLPQIDRVEVYIIEEPQPRWLAFLNGEHDLIDRVPAEYMNIAAPGGKLAPNLLKKKMQLDRAADFDLTFFYFTMTNPVVGGYTPEKVALRRAISLAFDTDEAIRALYRGQAVVAQSTVPPQAIGADPDLIGPLAEFNPAKAKALLDVYGYVDRDGDGYREAPDGSKLALEIATTPDTQGKITDELFHKFLDRVGLKSAIRKARWPEHLRDARAGKLMMWQVGWLSSNPDAETFYEILYGPNKGQSNLARFDLPQLNALFDKAKVLEPTNPERDRLYRQIDDLLFAYAPLRPMAHRIVTAIAQPWLVGYRRNPVKRDFWQFLDIDERALPAPQSGGASAAGAPAR